MKNLMTKTMKTLAVAGMTMGLALGAKADTVACTNCLTFSADKPFGIRMIKYLGGKSGKITYPAAPDVSLEYSTDQVNWQTFKPDTDYAAGADHKLYLRGKNNATFASARYKYSANVFTNAADSAATAIACSGNIETLLDYTKVAAGEHPTMVTNAFCCLFRYFHALTTAPVLPAKTLTDGCYYLMFNGCTSLTAAPALPATTLQPYCYYQMFNSCESLTTAPDLPAMTLADSCYYQMFQGCSSLTAAPALPAKTMTENCYGSMFLGTSLTDLPDLPATTLAKLCYGGMFCNCPALKVNTNAPGKEWWIPEEAATSAATAERWSQLMFTKTAGTFTDGPTPGTTYYIASAPVEFRVTQPEHATFQACTNGAPVSVPFTGDYLTDFTVTYTADKGYVFPDGKTEFTTNITERAETVTVTLPKNQQPIPRSPDYARDDGYDWLFNHAIKGKQYENEAFADNGVDVFFIYPTLMTKVEPALQYKGFRLMDDPEMREMTVAGWTDSVTSAFDAFWKNARCLGDLGYVYAPFYRQATNPHMIEQGTYANLTNMIYHGYGYLDITNALETYFAKWNKGRKFILAAHSQGSATLMLALEHYFTQDDAHKQYLKNLVASYQIGMGVGREWIANLEKNTKTTGFDGVKFASTSNDVGVVISYNTTGEGGSGQSILFPSDAMAINPISWTTTDAKAEKSLNLGSLTNAEPDRIVYGLHGAKVNATRGTVEADGFGDADWIEPSDIFGGKCLHNQDYKAFWEDLHKNAYDRIAAATGKFPLVGQPTDYADKDNWMAFGDFATKVGGTDKPFDVFFLYPTCELSPVDYVGDINDDMKMKADEQYVQDVQPLETYANMYAPYYRQISMFYLFATPDPDSCQQNLARHVGKTDTFAALDYYFEKVNPDGARPFVLVGHSQGSASLKTIFEQYFVGEKKALLKKMIATYPVGWVFSTDWCKEYGYTFATGASDTNVVITWNTEGPNVPLPSQNYFTSDPNGQAINPLNWATNSTYAPIEANLGSYKNGELVAGGADGQLDPVNRPGALVVTNTTFKSIDDPNLGKETYHITEFAMFRENVCDNILQRGKALTDYERIVPPNLPEHVRMSGAKVDGADLTAVGGGYWAVASADSVEVVVTPTNENQKVVFVNGEREMPLAMKYEDGAWVPVMSDTEIAAATKASDKPVVQLGIVAQRYPWNGTLDVQYRAQYTPTGTPATITVTANGQTYTQDVTISAGVNTLEFTKLPAEIKAKDAKVTLKIK